MEIRTALAAAIVANELGGDLSLAYRFSDPDGVRTGRSGWSFGRCQFDLSHNTHAAVALEECGFTGAEISALEMQVYGPADMERLNARLHDSAAVVDRLDREEFDRIYSHVLQAVTNAGLHLQDEETFVHLADYHNQFRLDFGGKCIRHMQALGDIIRPADVLEFKRNHTRWGKKRPDDVRRRFDNIARIMDGEPRGEAS